MLSVRSRFPFKVLAPRQGLLSLLLCSVGSMAITACQPAVQPAATDDATLEPELSPPPPPDSAFLALLAPEQTAQIKALGFPLVVPTAIPAGFGIEQVETSQDDRFSGYQILYRDGRDRCFLVEYTSGGVGDMPQTEERIAINPPLVESTTSFGLNYGRYTDPNLASQFSDPVLMSDWLPIKGGFYRLTGAAYANQLLDPTPACQDITPEEAVAIVESSALVSEEIQGDGMMPAN